MSSSGAHQSERLLAGWGVIMLPCVLQVNFTLVAGNMEDVFKIKTVNHTYGEVFVNAPLDRESVDRYLLKVRQENSRIKKKEIKNRYHRISFCVWLDLLFPTELHNIASTLFLNKTNLGIGEKPLRCQ